MFKKTVQCAISSTTTPDTCIYTITEMIFYMHVSLRITAMDYCGMGTSVLNEMVSFIQRALNREVPLYFYLNFHELQV